MLYKILATMGLIVATTSADATVTNSFAGGVFGFQAGDTAIADFDSTFGGAVLTGGSGYYTGLNSGIAAPPAGDTTQYLAVLGGGTASFTFGPTNMVSFDVGSVDDYNSLTVTLFDGGTPTTLTGTQINNNVANGNQTSSLQNGRLTIFGTAGEQFTGLELVSSANSFEIDNLAVRNAVPEVSTWAMFILGFGGIGAASRRRKTVRTTFAR